MKQHCNKFHKGVFFLIVVYLCATLCNTMDCSPPCSSVNGISQARTLEQVGISFSGDLPDPGLEPTLPILAGKFFTTEPQGKPFKKWSTSKKRKETNQQLSKLRDREGERLRDPRKCINKVILDIKVPTNTHLTLICLFIRIQKAEFFIFEDILYACVFLKYIFE